MPANEDTRRNGLLHEEVPAMGVQVLNAKPANNILLRT